MIPVQVPFYLESRTGASGTLIGVALTVVTFTDGIVSLLYGRIRHHMSVITLVSLTFVFMSIGYLSIGVSRTFLGIVAGLALVGPGVGLILPDLNSWIAAVTPETVRGRAISGLTSALFPGQFLSPVEMRPMSEIVGLSRTFLGVGVVLGGAVAFALAAAYATPPTESEPISDKQPVTERSFE